MNTSVVSPGRAGLLLLLTGQMLPMIDTSITNVALDSITLSLHTNTTQLSLIVALYGVAFAVCLAMGSKLGDNLGRRKIFLWGVALFGIASLLCGLANSITALLAARTLQGMSAALIMPQILATLHVTLKGPAHARAISLYGGIGGVAFIIGQMGGGWLVSADIAGLGWRNAFFINVPISLLVLALSHRYVPETRNEAPTRIDWQGTFALALILCCLLFPLSLSPDLGWPWQSQVALLAIIPLTLWMRAGALRQERNGLHPLMPPRLLKLASIRFGLLIALLFFCAWSGFMFCMALTLQAGVGMAPWQSGNSFVVLGLFYFASACYAPKLIARHSLRTILLSGIAIQISGLAALFATIWLTHGHLNALNLAPSTALIGYGQALIVNSFYRIGMRDIASQDAGSGSAILSTLQQATLGLGPAVLGGLFLHLLNLSQGNYNEALGGFLVAEIVMMLLLAVAALGARQQLAPRCPAN
ncbi:MFS transporter [Phytobacter ursingii]|uniref:MFS transporter n=1 Tax=Phytobacter ursingii TaxID=1972431 RepID=UPI000CD29B36|nr:MFS transporter [Enterobacteriaceae bacterium ENNIH1]